MVQRIVITTKELSRTFWEMTYSFIRDCSKGNELDESYCMTYSVQFPRGGIKHPGPELLLVINYQKDSYKDDFPEMVPFFMVTHDVENIYATLAINLEAIDTDIKAQESYIFKCSEFFRFVDTRSDFHRIVIWNEKVTDKATGEIRNFRKDGLTSLRTKAESDPASRKFLPLIEITKDVFERIFEKRNDRKETTSLSAVEKYIRDVLRKISGEVKYEISNSSLFEEWFVKSYFYYLQEQHQAVDYSALKDILHIYCSNIFELAQNIIFHTSEQRGLMYFVFSLFSDLSSEQKSKLLISSEDGENPLCRFITIGIIDFNQEGISESFHRKYYKEAELDLKEFYSPKQLSTNEVTHLDFRRMAHIGLPVLMSTIRNYRGCFRVESSHHHKKKGVELRKGDLVTLPSRDYVDGTHYEILLPIVPSQETQTAEWSLMQKSSILNRLIHIKKGGFKPIPFIKLSNYLPNESEIRDKEYQAAEIEAIGKKIIEAFGTSRELAIDFDEDNIQPSTIVKLISYLQMMGGVYHPVIILTSLSEALIDLICSLIITVLVRAGVKPVWSPDSAVVLLSKGLRYQIISGSYPESLYRINADYQNYYYSQKNYFEKELSDFSNLVSTENLDRFILPYELLMGNKKNSYSFFYSYVKNLLKQPMDKEKMGYCLNQYTYIGNKLIVKYFYEADALFQNSFFTDRFAFIIAERIISNVQGVSSLVIIGYKFYSEQLIKTVARYLENTYDIRCKVFIADEDNDGHLSINVTQSERDDLLVKKFVTIVPIGATISTNDKIIAIIKEQFGEDADVVYNHCSIVVRDVENNKIPTIFEEDQKWVSIDFDNQVVSTRFENAKEIHYDILLGALKPNESNWVRRPNPTISFPDDYEEEEYVNHTENASINSQNLMGIPRFDIFATGEEYDHIGELKRLLDMKETIYSDHIECNGAHFRYYFDTETYVQLSTEMFNAWLDSIANNNTGSKNVFELNRFNIIISPNARIESDLVNLVNEKVFGGNALILFFDVNNWTNNYLNKFSYVSELVKEKGQDIHFHFVDHSLYTASTFKKTESFLKTLCPGVSFKSGIVVINRLNFDLREEIRQHLDGNLFVYFNLFVPETSDSRSHCTQCDLDDYYERLMNSTAMTSCREVIEYNREKIKLKKFSDLKRLGKPITDRRFLRLFFAHEISYRISRMDSEETLEALYKELFATNSVNRSEALSLLNIKYPDGAYLYDKRISFLKALSSPPLSRYIIIRKFAHEVLLKTLSLCLGKTESECQYDDFRMLKAVLKSLSFYKSNAIIRKSVILDSWKLQEWNLRKAVNDLKKAPKESLFSEKDTIELNDRIAKLSSFGKYYQFYIKNAVFEDGSKSCFLGELLRTGEERRESPLMVSRTLRKEKNSLLKQFFDNDLFQAFLLDVFYDNTTITRRTLADFEHELSRNNALKDLFYSKESKSHTQDLIPFHVFKNNIEEAAEIFRDIVSRGYYYSDFVPYVYNEDYYRFVEKFCCLLYLRLKFNQLSTQPIKDLSIEQELTEFLRGFSYIMDADFCIYAAGEKEEVYVLDDSIDNTQELSDSSSSRGTRFPHESYLNRLFSRDLALGFFIEKDCIRPSDQEAERKREFPYVCSFIINCKSSLYDKNQAICFFFKEKTDTERFLIHINEGARLLLLLRQEIDRFFVDFLLKEKVIDLWIDKIESTFKFEKIYDDSAHVFKSVFREMGEFDKLPHEYLKKVARTWYWLTNETISYFYSNIEKNIDNQRRNHLNLGDKSEVLKGEDTIQDVFSKEFLCLVSQLLIDRWDEQMCSISINGIAISDFSNDQLPRTPLHCKRHVIQTFLAQCLHNSLGELSSHGHREDDEKKHVMINVDENSISLHDVTISGGCSDEDKKAIAQAFTFQSIQIKELNCKHYSSTTLTSIQGFTKLMQSRGYNYDFDFGFAGNPLSFNVRIQFQ